MKTDGWFEFEGTPGCDSAEHSVYDEQVELSGQDAKEHKELVRRVGEEYGFPIPTWQPIIPTRTG